MDVRKYVTNNATAPYQMAPTRLLKMHGISIVQVVLVACTLVTVSPTFAPPILKTSQFVVPSRTILRAMKVNIRIVGKKTGGEKWLDEACSMYQSRLKTSGVEVSTEFHKSDSTLVKGVHGDYDKGHSVVMLDPRGEKYTSEELASSIYKWIEAGGSRLAFVIGGGE